MHPQKIWQFGMLFNIARFGKVIFNINAIMMLKRRAHMLTWGWGGVSKRRRLRTDVDIRGLGKGMVQWCLKGLRAAGVGSRHDQLGSDQEQVENWMRKRVTGKNKVFVKESMMNINVK